MVENIVRDLLAFVKNKEEVENSVILPEGFKQMFKECLCCLNKEKITVEHKLKIGSVVNYMHDMIHTGHWSKVSTEIRKGFTAASFIQAIILLKISNNKTCLAEALKCLDMGLLLGAPLEENFELLTNCASYLNREIFILKSNKNQFKEKSCSEKANYSVKYSQISAEEVPHKNIPSLEYFITHHFHSQTPLVLRGCMTHWPATKKWANMHYLMSVMSERTVPIEIGSQYSDDNWSQKLMTVGDFMNKHYFENCDEVGYLAQHNLFDQIPVLKKDICTPEYCCVSRNESLEDNAPEVEINAWLGPRGTISSLHYDPKDNILAQVYGLKQVLLYAPSDTEKLYPHPSDMLSNTSQVDPLNPDFLTFPKFKDAKMCKCLIHTGDMLYIPPKWWHHVTSLDKSFSVNFWWT